MIIHFPHCTHSTTPCLINIITHFSHTHALSYAIPQYATNDHSFSTNSSTLLRNFRIHLCKITLTKELFRLVPPSPQNILPSFFMKLPQKSKDSILFHHDSSRSDNSDTHHILLLFACLGLTRPGLARIKETCIPK